MERYCIISRERTGKHRMGPQKELEIENDVDRNLDKMRCFLTM